MSRLTTFATEVVSRGEYSPGRPYIRVNIRTKLAKTGPIPVLEFAASPAHGLMYDGTILDRLLEELCPDCKQ